MCAELISMEKSVIFFNIRNYVHCYWVVTLKPIWLYVIYTVYYSYLNIKSGKMIEKFSFTTYLHLSVILFATNPVT